MSIGSLSQEELLDEFFKPGGLESNSTLDNSLIAATTRDQSVALVLKHLPIEVINTDECVCVYICLYVSVCRFVCVLYWAWGSGVVLFQSSC